MQRDEMLNISARRNLHPYEVPSRRCFVGHAPRRFCDAPRYDSRKELPYHNGFPHFRAQFSKRGPPPHYFKNPWHNRNDSRFRDYRLAYANHTRSWKKPNPSASTSCNSSFTSCPATSAVPFYESHHGKLRRKQRNLGIRDLQAAMRYGTRRPGQRRPFSNHPTSIYQHHGVRYVVDDVTGREITSYTVPVQLGMRPISTQDQSRHDEAVHNLQTNPSSWTSHSVLLLDRSGSMKATDVHGSRTRLDAVLVAVAEDFVAHRIRTGTGGDRDVVTVVLMGDKPKILFKHCPTDWVLYNEFVKLLRRSRARRPRRKVNNNPPRLMEEQEEVDEDEIFPQGHGNYLPSLQSAKELLSTNTSASCALALVVLSDGRPSDYFGSLRESSSHIQAATEELASQFGKRLVLSTVGIGCGHMGRGWSQEEEFCVLRDMARVGKEYGAEGMFQLPALTPSRLAAAFQSVASSLTTTQVELTMGQVCGGNVGVVDKGGGGSGRRMRKVRDVRRERASMIPCLTEVVDADGFDIYLEDRVHRMVYDPTTKQFLSAPLQHSAAAGVAIRKLAFGEGGERLAHQFFEVASDGFTVVGEPLVAKQSRFVEEEPEANEDGKARWLQREEFVKKFCERQSRAKQMAEAFNRRMEEMKCLDPLRRVCVSFVDCCVYYIDPEVQKAVHMDGIENIGELIEEDRGEDRRDNAGGIKEEERKSGFRLEVDKVNRTSDTEENEEQKNEIADVDLKGNNRSGKHGRQNKAGEHKNDGPKQEDVVVTKGCVVNTCEIKIESFNNDGIARGGAASNEKDKNKVKDNSTGSLEEYVVLVEPKLHGKFQKWNGNNGFVRNQTFECASQSLKRNAITPSLRVIEEREDVIALDKNGNEYLHFSPSEVAQAFSHFSFFHSGEQMLLCDLQGVYMEIDQLFRFTDPVIHYYDRQKPQKKNMFGRTDMGRRGVEAFFRTHSCNGLCRLVTGGFRKAKSPRSSASSNRKRVRCDVMV